MTSPHYKRAVVILIDGARPDILKQEQQKGNLPHLSALAQRGCQHTMLTCFPSTTGPAYLPYLTGCGPGQCHIPGIRWFDKNSYAQKGWGFNSFRSYCGFESRWLDADLNQKIKTVWDLIPSSKNIFGTPTKGILSKNDLTRHCRPFYYLYAHLTNHWGCIDQAAFRKLRRVICDQNFEFVFLACPAVDEFAHRFSPVHFKTQTAYRTADALIGETVALLKQQNLFDDTLIFVVSDHGCSEVHTHFDVGPWLQSERGIKTFFYSNIFKFNFSAVSMVSGNGMSHLYFKGIQGWKGRTSFEELSTTSDLLTVLSQRPEILLMVTQGQDGAIHFQNNKGHGFFNYNTDQKKIFYNFSNGDPLEILSNTDPLLKNGFSFDESLRLSFESQYPDVFYQMHQLFQSSRTGDVVVCAKTGYDLRKKFEHPLHHAGHGSITPEHMKVPLICNVPIVSPHIRSVDVFPTILHLLGKEIPLNVEGKDLMIF